MRSEPGIRFWDGYAEPFRIFGNLYFVGTRPASTHVIDTGDGLILIDPGFPETFNLILDNMEQVGLDPKKIRLILNTHGHIDHFGATKALADYTGAKTALGRRDLAYATGAEPLSWAGELGYANFTGRFLPDILLDDGSKLKMGNTAVTCKAAPGHTPGTMAFFFNVTDGEMTYRCGMHGGVGLNTMKKDWLEFSGIGFSIREEFVPAIKRLMDEPVDITLGNHVQNNDTLGKAKRLGEAQNPFVDKGEWKRFLQSCIRNYEEMIAAEK